MTGPTPGTCRTCCGAEAYAADARRLTDAAWRRLRLVYQYAADKGIDIGEESLREHFREMMAIDIHAQLERDAFETFYTAVVQHMHRVEDEGMAPEEGWRELVAWQRKRGHPVNAAKVTMASAREKTLARLDAIRRDCPAPGNDADPYGTTPLPSFAEWGRRPEISRTEQQE